MILRINGKCSDMFFATLETMGGKLIGHVHDGYVPSFMPGEHYGDYITLDIDVKTGKILNWVPPSKKQLTKVFGNF